MEKNTKNKSQMITVLLEYKEIPYQFSTESAKPIELFFKEVCSYLELNPRNFLLKYNNQRISLKSNQNMKISDIIDNNNPNASFKLLPKKTKTINVRYQSLETDEQNNNNNNIINTNNNTNYNTINNINNKSLSLSSRNVRNNLKSFTTKQNKMPKESLKIEGIGAIITKYTSVEEVEKILEDFNMNNIHFPNKKGILTNLGNNSVRVDFNTEAYLNEFINYILFIKYENPHYNNIVIKKDVSNLNNKFNKRGISNLNLPHLMNNFDRKYNYVNNNNNPLSKSAAKPKLKLKIKIDDVIKALKHNELKKDTYHGLSLKTDGEDGIITDYYQQQSFLRNSSPYINEYEKHILEEKENKKLLFKNKNFVTSVGKYSMKPNFIPNYVGLTPGENPKNHEFRSVDKNKWMNKKGFNI